MTETVRKKIMAFILTLTMVISFIPAMTLTASADGEESTSLEGEGSEGNPFKIASAADLAYMRQQVNAGETITPRAGGEAKLANTAYYELTTDIVLGFWQDDGDGIAEDGEICDPDSGTPFSISNWEPIGTYDNRFRGTFDGNSNKVSGIYINGTDDYQGLFGYVDGGTIKSLRVEDSYIKGNQWHRYFPLGDKAGHARKSVMG